MDVTRRITKSDQSQEFSRRLNALIPGGAHTYSKGDDQFPSNAPAAITHGRGAHVWDIDGNEFIDCSMGLTSVSIGHGYEPVSRAVADAAAKGTNFQRPSADELPAAEHFLASVQSGEMVKFSKNGSTVTTAAIKLARAYTGRNRVALCRDHSFFSYDDWFIATTPCDRGIPDETRRLSVHFGYNDAASVEALFSQPGHDIACLIMEPVTDEPPADGFLARVRELCTTHGVVFILDEMVSGMKWGVTGAQAYFGVQPDLTTWGKGIANGFSCCALTGRADIMELGGIQRAGEDRVFLISTTHGAETTGLAAMHQTLLEFERHDMVARNWRRGERLARETRQVVDRHGLGTHLRVTGYPCLLSFECGDSSGAISASYRTLLMQEMIARGVLFQGIFYCTWSHQEAELDYVVTAFDSACGAYRTAIDAGTCDGLLVGPPVKPVFRRKI